MPIYEKSGAKTRSASEMSHSDAATVLKDGRMRQYLKDGLIKKNVLAFQV